MKFALIICTYQRSESLALLMQTVCQQTLYPDQIIIVDASFDGNTNKYFNSHSFKNLNYYLVDELNRGLTKQRNFGIKQIKSNIDIVCFLDDDTLLDNHYFFEVINTFKSNDEITGVGGVAVNENHWIKRDANFQINEYRYYQLNEFIVQESLRNIIRKYLNLQSNKAPGVMPEFSHGRTCGYPLDGNNYQVELLIGMSMSFRRKVIDNIKFSTYFEGYGLYEDADFSIRALKFGKNIICTKAKLEHHHHPSGRPNQYNYGKMVVKNGWYVWRLRWPNPSLNAQVKWHLITLLLAFIRLANVFTTSNRQAAFTEFLGRISAYFKLWVVKPKIEK